MVIPRPKISKKKSLILSPDAKNDFNHKSKYSKLFLPKANILKNILTLSPKAQAKTCLGLCLNCVAYGLTLGQNKLIFKYVFFVYGVG